MKTFYLVFSILALSACATIGRENPPSCDVIETAHGFEVVQFGFTYRPPYQRVLHGRRFVYDRRTHLLRLETYDRGRLVQANVCDLRAKYSQCHLKEGRNGFEVTECSTDPGEKRIIDGLDLTYFRSTEMIGIKQYRHGLCVSGSIGTVDHSGRPGYKVVSFEDPTKVLLIRK